MNAENVCRTREVPARKAGSAEGLDKKYWFVAIVKNNTEKSVAQKLLKSGYECYVPIQEELRIWKNGRKVKVERVVIPAIVFVRCTEMLRKEIVTLPFIIRFMVDCAGTLSSAGSKPLATIPHDQIEKLRFMLGCSETPVTFTPGSYKRGDLVRVVRGKLTGLEGEVQVIDTKHSEIIVRVDFLGNAKLSIETINVEPLS